MEREYFRDRPESIKYNKYIYRGCVAFICLKKMQPYAKEISDLSLIEVTQNLTKQPEHPRGQKVKGNLINTDKYGNKIYIEDKEEVVGRCTYLLDENEWSLDTKDGKKVLIYNSNKKNIDIVGYELLKEFIKIYAILELGNITFKIPICRYAYFKTIREAREFLDKIVLERAFLIHAGVIMANLNNKVIYEDKYEVFINNERSSINEVVNLLGYEMNVSELTLRKYILEKIL